MSFNLIDEPFIPCLDLQGMPCELSLRETLLRASNLRELRDDSPLVTVALHRLLLAILHRNFGPASLPKWKEIWGRSGFDDSVLTSYFGKWHERFDVFHPERPFFQVAGFATKEPSGINRLAQEMARGNNATLFDHTLDNPSPRLAFAHAARLVIAEQSFAVGGGKSDLGNTTHAPLVSGAIVMPQGQTLFETLLLNMVVYNRESPCPSKDDRPVWERDDAPAQGATFPAGYLDYLTWQTRTLRLVCDGDRVAKVFYAQGRKFDPPPGFYEPSMAYRRDKDEGDRPIRFTEEKDLWRDSSALFQFDASQQFCGPLCFKQMQTLVREKVIRRSQRFDFATLGLCTDKAKVAFWRRERLPLPPAYLDDKDLVERLRNAIGLADEVGKHVRMAAWKTASTLLSNGQMSPDKARVADLVDSLSPDRLYWSRLEVPFRKLLVDLPGESEGDIEHQEIAVARWVCDTMKPQARAAFDETVGSLNQTGRKHHAVTLGREQLENDLLSVTKPHQEKLNEVATVHRA